MMDSYWLKSDQEAHKQKVDKENKEMTMNVLDQYWKKKDEKGEETGHAETKEVVEEAKE